MDELSKQMELNNKKRAEEFGNLLKNLEQKYVKRKSITASDNPKRPRRSTRK